MTRRAPIIANQRQSEAWNGAEADHYVDHADRYDRQLAPFGDAVLEHVTLEPHHSVLDVGCGSGATTLAVAQRAGAALGVDISHPLINVAIDRARAASLGTAKFLVADAQTHAFDSGGFDLIISQFGLMFFDDPVSAFANLRRSLARVGEVAFVCWQGLEANEWVSLVGDAVGRHVVLPDLGGMAGGPGMFSLKHPHEVSELLGSSGFTHVEIEPVTPQILIGGGGTLDASIDFFLGMGIVRGLVGHGGPDVRPQVIEDVRSSLVERYEPGVGVRLGAAGWLVSARK